MSLRGQFELSVLLADCDPAAVSLQRLLKRNGFRVAWAKNGQDALMRAREMPPDLLLLEWTLPVVTGFEICRQLRSRRESRNLPIIMVTSRDSESDRIRGLDVGADDYVTKPYFDAELIARISALLRRVRPGLIADIIQADKLELNRTAHRVRYAGREVPLRPIEIRLLHHFLQYPGRVFNREQMLDAVWGTDADVEVRTVDVCVGRVRRALERAGGKGLIRTVRSGGYSFG